MSSKGATRVPRLVGKTNRAGVTNWYWQPSKTLRDNGWLPLCLGAALGSSPSEEIIAACRAENLKVDGAKQRRSGRSAALQSRAERTKMKVIARLERKRQWVERRLKLLRDPESEAESHLKSAALGSVASSVYFIAAVGGPIKIGLAVNPLDRLRSLQTAHPKKLRLLATVPGDHRAEAAYHQRFATHRLQGEWFAPHAEILDEIRRIRSNRPTF